MDKMVKKGGTSKRRLLDSLCLPLGSRTKCRIISFIILDYQHAKLNNLPQPMYSLSELANKSRVSWRSINMVWPQFIQLEVVKLLKSVGKVKLYAINEKSELTQHFDAVVSIINARLFKSGTLDNLIRKTEPQMLDR